jgi:hypothetical protein
MTLMVIMTCGGIHADDESIVQRIASRTQIIGPPSQQTHDRAGTATPAKLKAPGIQSRDGFGVVNGMTFGSDDLGSGRRTGRIFPGLFFNRDTQPVRLRYQSDGPIHVPDPIAAKPFRKAVLEANQSRHDQSSAEGHR